MHLLKAIPNAGKYLEFSIEGADYYPWQQELFLEDPYSVDDGKVTISDKPGWGIEISQIGWKNQLTNAAKSKLLDTPKLIVLIF